MKDMHVIALISQHNQWLQARQSAVSSNISAANIPGYKTQDVKPFEAVLNDAGLRMATTDSQHIGGGDLANLPVERARTPGAEVLHSGNNVSLEQELVKAGEVSKAYSINTSVMTKFHQLLIVAARGSG
ncbi:MAG: flagellar basal body rod protein FlgB [Hyphomicrobiales bacterium]|nr:flagellar basal body rod protein FlgB [Hyphomicrobiales bacterium]